MVWQTIKNIFSRNKLADHMPPVRGKLTAFEPLHKKNWFGVGGPAEVFFEPADSDDLSFFLKRLPDLPITILGAGSNVLIRDGGIPGVTIHLTKNFAPLRVERNLITVGAGIFVSELARVAEKNGLSGFEFLSGIPGSVGGAVRMNAGAYGRSISDCLVSLKIMTPDGLIQTLDTADTRIFDYRFCSLPAAWIVLEAVFKGTPAASSDIAKKMAEYKVQRDKAQPKGVKTAGSFFKNPAGLQVWKLIDAVGMRGARVGGASVSLKHANFLINDKGASAADIEALGNEITRRVLDKTGVRLEWEVKRLGVKQ